LAAVLFSLKAIWVKLAYQHGVDAITLLTLRMLFALPIFLVIAYIEQRKAAQAISVRQFMAIIGLGLLGYYLASLLDFIGLQYISAGLERLILFLFPTLTLLLSMLFLGRKITAVEGILLLISYLGIALIMQQEVSLQGEHIVFGMVLVFASALAYAIYLIGSGEFIPQLGARRFMAFAMIISCLAVILQFFIMRDLHTLNQTTTVYGYGIAIALFSTVLPAFMLAAAIARIGAAHTAIVGSIGPVVTIILAVYLLGETMNSVQVIGAGMVIGCVVLLSLYGKR